MKKLQQMLVLNNEVLAPGVYSMELAYPAGQEPADIRPGQFVGVYCRDGSRLLPRPISICSWNCVTTTARTGTESDRKDLVHSLRLVYRTAGAGTRELAGIHAGEQVRVLGVLGNGYDLSLLEGKRVLLMAGGIGAPPMLGLARECSRRKAAVTAVLGYRSQPLFLREEFEQYGQVIIATDDGSAGIHGTVLDAAAALEYGAAGVETTAHESDTGRTAEEQSGTKEYEPAGQAEVPCDVICACGPLPMLRGVRELGKKWKVPCYISMEEHMACGVGACLGCVVKTAHRDGHSQVNNARICTEGPVFNAEEIVF